MRVRGEAPIGEAASPMSRRAGNACAGSCDPIPDSGRAEGCGRPGKARAIGAPDGLSRRDAPHRCTAMAMRRGTCVHAWRSARVVSDLQDVKKSRGYGVRGTGYGMMHRLCHCQPATALTVVMALHRHPFNPRVGEEFSHAWNGSAVRASVTARDLYSDPLLLPVRHGSALHTPT